jgi:drug/metabolite transporter (DMT)-like permease
MTNSLHIISKIMSEALLSLYPVFVKHIDLPIQTQMWSRFFTYSFFSMFFIDKTIVSLITSWNGILLMIVTMIHVFVSYQGFLLLESGISYALFYTYPLFIYLGNYFSIHPYFIFPVLGTGLMYYDNKEINVVGIIMILLAAITEAMIYFIVRRLKTSNPWNHVFISYVLGAVLFSVFIKDIQKFKSATTLISVGINAIIGLIGYLLRFYATTRLSPILFSFLSYIGIVMAFIYGVIFSQESITFYKILSTILILIPSIQQKLLPA